MFEHKRNLLYATVCVDTVVIQENTELYISVGVVMPCYSRILFLLGSFFLTGFSGAAFFGSCVFSGPDGSCSDAPARCAKISSGVSTSRSSYSIMPSSFAFVNELARLMPDMRRCPGHCFLNYSKSRPYASLLCFLLIK